MLPLFCLSMKYLNTTKHITCDQALFKKNVANEKLRESVAEALGAVVNTYRRMPGRADHQVCTR